jgi:ribonuclease P protein component
MWRKFRLRQRSDFLRLRQEGRPRSNSFLVLSYVKNHLTHNRYGFITSKGVGKAVVRNRVRRLLREATRHYLSDVLQGYDVVAIARKPIVGQSYAQILAQLGKLYAQAGLLKKE